MCGRYLFKPEDYPDILKSNAAKADDFQGGVVFPSTKAPIITKKLEVEMHTWGKRWHFNPRILLHARAEGVMEKPTFRNAYSINRIIIPTSGFYEWKHVKGKSQKGEKYFFYSEESSRLYLGGLLLDNEYGYAFVIITRPAEEWMEDIHTREPLLIPEEEVSIWLQDYYKADRFLSRPQMALAREYQGEDS